MHDQMIAYVNGPVQLAANRASEPVEERPQGICQNAPDLLAR
jgi:hypothetical protein